MNNAVGDTAMKTTAAAAAPQPGSIALDPDLSRRLEEFRVKEEKKEALRRQVWRERSVLLPVLAVALAALPNFRMAQVAGNSMAPTFEPGDRLVLLKTYKYFSPVKPGDVIVIRLNHGKYKGEEWVKRVVFIQNDQGNKPWPTSLPSWHAPIPTEAAFPAYQLGLNKVPPSGLMVMGDNFYNSTDSRDEDIGPISPDEIVGKVLNP